MKYIGTIDHHGAVAKLSKCCRRMPTGTRGRTAYMRFSLSLLRFLAWLNGTDLSKVKREGENSLVR